MEGLPQVKIMMSLYVENSQRKKTFGMRSRRETKRA